MVVVDHDEVDDKEVTHHLRKEMKELRVENGKLMKEVEDTNAGRVRLTRERDERADKYSRLKNETQQQQKEHAAQLNQQ